ncbi:unnamed protein product [Oncorhynchus mykiss]|uniref:PH domain-containing protein n=1 Tax=Oncorhynchus mykiss TaxID=8022 RepID=A0A060WXU5_ONCMY|nr:unnamed protein product [Oncorhynchus mykiss]
MGDVSRGPCRPSSPSLQEGALKAGWLKKQRSIMKNWQLKWFVLRSDQLYFYKDEEETKPQGCIPLQGCQVNELTANPEEPGRHIFEIIPGEIIHQHHSLSSFSRKYMCCQSGTCLTQDFMRRIFSVLQFPQYHTEPAGSNADVSQWRLEMQSTDAILTGR